MLERWRGSAQLLHERPILADQRRRVSLLEPTRPAVVLGSTSPSLTSTSYDIVRRQTGGGLVWLDPALSTWLDVFIPADDELWCRDVARSFDWLGRAIAEAFVSVGVPARAYQGKFDPGAENGLICFGSLGHGEVVLDETVEGGAVPGGAVPRKLVGISQRRTRLGSRFQCIWYEHFSLGAITQLASAEVCAVAKERACGWASLGSSFGPSTSTSIAQRVIASITGA